MTRFFSRNKTDKAPVACGSHSGSRWETIKQKKSPSATEMLT